MVEDDEESCRPTDPIESMKSMVGRANAHPTAPTTEKPSPSRKIIHPTVAALPCTRSPLPTPSHRVLGCVWLVSPHSGSIESEAASPSVGHDRFAPMPDTVAPDRSAERRRHQSEKRQELCSCMGAATDPFWRPTRR